MRVYWLLRRLFFNEIGTESWLFLVQLPFLKFYKYRFFNDFKSFFINQL